MDSSYLGFETPVKRFISSKDIVKLDKNQCVSKRFSPTKEMQSLLVGLRRIHKYQFHTEVKLIDLKSMNILTFDLVRSIRDFFLLDSPDIPDIIQDFQNIGESERYYNKFLENYIAEEFGTIEEYSFAIIAMLHYMHTFSVSLEETIRDMFSLSVKESICELCCETGTKEPTLECDRFNLKTIKLMMAESLEASDYDSVNDADYKNNDDEVDTSSSSDEETNYISKDLRKNNQEYSDTINFEFNPFSDPNPVSVSVSGSQSHDQLNSTILFNPFTADATSESPLRVLRSTSNKSCKLCSNSFTTNYNLKQHMISVHRIIEPGVKVYKCNSRGCSFVTGSQSWFARHNCKSKRDKPTILKPNCSYCHASFANPSSLKRHINRLHSK